MFTKILLPLDGSPLAEAALPAACELANKFDAELTLLRVVAPPKLLAFGDGRAYAEMLTAMRLRRREEAEDYLLAHKGSLVQQGYKVQTVVIEGESAALGILDTVEAQKLNAIVMSTHGRGRAGRWVYGSVADRVLRLAKVPILLLRVPEAILAIDVPPIHSEADMQSHELA